jgi:type I restriction enzyme R subunit
MAVYTESGGEGKAVLEIEDIIAAMKTKFEIVEQMFHGYEYKKFFKATSQDKLQILLGAGNFIL